MQEKELFVNILKDHKKLLYKVINAYCRDLDDRKDLEQEIIIQLWSSLKNYKAEFKLSTWIYRIALNVAISFYRRDFKRKQTNESYDEAIFQIAAEEDVSDEYRDKMALLYQFINKLDELDKAIIILYLDVKSYKEIAEIIGLTETHVGRKINRIKGKLKDSIFKINK